MNDEIKEILDRIKNYPEKLYCLNNKEKIIILNYITNLQQKVEQYENPDDLTLFYMWLDEKAKDKMKELQQENEKIKERCDYLQRSCDRKEEQRDYAVMEYMKQDDYKERNEKAIEIIEKYKKDEGLTMYHDTWQHLYPVYFALKGDYKNE